MTDKPTDLSDKQEYIEVTVKCGYPWCDSYTTASGPANYVIDMIHAFKNAHLNCKPNVIMTAKSVTR